ncbi:c-type cytochrome [Thiothrix lacustris]|uniref:Cytochrome c n=1 Tax=Thiothrix lacustris TaxID=525917 RepID=A0ABY9MP62_9GAMM|nr:cytochrome c [Thiothrix lacustris]WML90347.1 cytochrome c [Thiothrix lacustris]WMP18010.1 cytochrome c [Thiothrix lacustris]
MNRFQQLLTIVLATASFTAASSAMADEEKSPEEQAISYRQGAFTMIKHHFGPMAAMVKGDVEFNAAEFTKNAEAVAALSKFPINGFVAGSYSGETEAKADIELNAEDFKKKMETFQVEAATLAEVAKGGDMAAIKPQFGKVGESCKACHKEYKED